MSKILLAGEGWGALAAHNSLKQSKNHDIFLLTTDPIWKANLLTENYKCVEDFSDSYDLVITAGWRPIIKQEVLQSHTILNIHYSLLPGYRGFHGTVWAILNNEPELGITIHRINEFIDDGPIVYQYKLPNNYIDSASDYMKKFNNHIEQELLNVVNDYIGGRRLEKKQEKSKASWVGRRKLSHCKIDFDKSIEYQKRLFRALSSPYPPPYFIHKGQIFEVLVSAFHETSVISDNGRILNIDNEGVWLSCAGGYIVCKKILRQSDHLEVPHNQFKIGQMAKS